MIAVDTSILVYAHRAEMPFHGAAMACMQSLAEGYATWGIPVSCLHEFLAVVTTARAFDPASTPQQALAQVEAWLASPRARVLHSGAQHWPLLATLSDKAQLQGGQFHDARIAAICLENSVSVLYTADRDFGRFKDLRTLNPLV